jgi:PP-loop superfamily ATP-utilizing enzyme
MNQHAEKLLEMRELEKKIALAEAARNILRAKKEMEIEMEKVEIIDQAIEAHELNITLLIKLILAQKTSVMHDVLLTKEDLEKFYKLKKRALDRLRKRGFPYVMLNGTTYYPKKDVDIYILEHRGDLMIADVRSEKEAYQLAG